MSVNRHAERMTKRVLIVLTSHGQLGDTGRGTGFYVSEAAEPWALFRDAGLGVDVVSVAGGMPPRDGEDPADLVQRRFLSEAGLDHTARVADADPGEYDAVFFPGGHGAMWDLPGNDAVVSLTRAVYEAGGVVAAVCHGPAALTGVTLTDGSYLVAGKRVAAFTDAEEEAAGLTSVMPFLLADRLVSRGAIHVPGPDFQAQVITDGRLVTGQNPASARGVAQAVAELLGGLVNIGDLDAYVVRPAGATAGVILAHQLFGLTADVRDAADRIAGLGYAVVAPDFFHRSERTVVLQADDEGRARGFALMGALTREGVLADVQAATGYLGAGRTGMVGLSMGGHLAYYAATQADLAVTVALYAGWLTGGDAMPLNQPEPTIELTAGIKGRLVYIVGDRDHVVTAEQRAEIAARLAADGVRHDLVVLPGAPHAFLAEGTSSYDAAAAAAAWQLIADVLAAELQ
jgi:dienelactone hydrolase/putative intracellular protease/amidase